MRPIHALSALMLAGCGDPLSRVELIDHTRVLGARVEVDGAPERVSPLPGETVHTRWFVVAPDPAATFAWSLSGCLAKPGNQPPLECLGAPLGNAASAVPLASPPTLDFTLPAAIPGDVTRVAELGGVCESGAALEASGSCSDGAAPQAVSLDFPLAQSAPNNNPNFTSIALDGVDWPAATALTTDCTQLPTVVPGSAGHALHVALDPSSRDPLPQASAQDPKRESLLLSTFITSGDVDAPWASIPSTQPNAETDVHWTAGGAGLARFFFVARDGRGGSDFVERRACSGP